MSGRRGAGDRGHGFHRTDVRYRARMESWEREILERSLVMAPPGTRALIDREEALVLLADIRRQLEWMKRLVIDLRRLADELEQQT